MTNLVASLTPWWIFLGHALLPGLVALAGLRLPRRGGPAAAIRRIHVVLIGLLIGLAVFGPHVTLVSVRSDWANRPPTQLRWHSGWVAAESRATANEPSGDSSGLKLWGRSRQVSDGEDPTGPRHLLVTRAGAPVHLLGTDRLGRDLLTLSLRGFRLTLVNGIIVTLLTYSLALILGGLAGLARRRSSAAILFVGDVLLCIPSIVIVLTVWIGLRTTKVTSEKTTYLLAMCAMSLVTWPWMARVVRNMVLSIKQNLFVEQSEAYGAQTSWLLGRHVLPQTMSFVIVAASIKLPHFMLAEAGLSLIGISPGFDPFGRVVVDNLQDWSLLPYYPWRVFPALLLLGAVIYSAALGDEIRDRTDRATLHRRTSTRGSRRRGVREPTRSPSPPSAGSGEMVVDGLTVTAGGTPLLKDASFRVRRGELLLVVGPTGVGKSTLLTSTVGLLPPGLDVQSGWLSIDGRNWNLAHSDGREVRGQRISYLFQEPGVALNPQRRVGEQIAESARLLRGVPRREALERATAELGRVSIHSPRRAATSYPGQLSGGELHRAGLAASLAGQPGFLFADEPLGALDSITRKELLTLFREFCRQGLGIVLVSHDPHVVAPFADRCIEVQPGGSVVQRDPSDFVASPITVPREDRRPAKAEAQPILRTRGLSFSIGSSRILDDVNVSLSQGEMVFVAGRSGCGKTSLLKLLSGRGVAHDGEVVSNGGEPLASSLGLQVLHQDYRASMNPRWTVNEILCEPLRIAKLADSAVRPRVLDSLRRVDLDPDLLSRTPGELSGGQRQRVAIARALACEPEVLLADEPVGAVHAELRREILALLRRLTRDSRLSCIVATHDLRDTFFVCDRGYVLRNGKVVDRGNPQALLHSTVPETRALLSAADLIES